MDPPVPVFIWLGHALVRSTNGFIVYFIDEGHILVLLMEVIHMLLYKHISIYLLETLIYFK